MAPEQGQRGSEALGLPRVSASPFSCGIYPWYWWTREVQAEASQLHGSRTCEMVLTGQGPTQASSVLDMQVAPGQQGWDLCHEAGRVPGYLGWWCPSSQLALWCWLMQTPPSW